MKLFFLLIFCSFQAFAYIPPTRIILEKTVENAGTASYQIEKLVQFSNPEIPTLKETWQVEGDRALRLTVTPVQASTVSANAASGSQFAGSAVQPSLTLLYVGGTRYALSGTAKETTKIPEEMTEKLFHFRKVANLVEHLNRLRILNTVQGHLDLARLNRSQGVVNFGLGKAGDDRGNGSDPYVWIEQDVFTIRKIRFSENSEMTANNYQVFPKGLNYPMVTNIHWTDQKVRMNTVSVNLVKKFQPTTFQSAQLEDSKPFLQSMARWNAVTEFYTRFR